MSQSQGTQYAPPYFMPPQEQPQQYPQQYQEHIQQYQQQQQQTPQPQPASISLEQQPAIIHQQPIETEGVVSFITQLLYALFASCDM